MAASVLVREGGAGSVGVGDAGTVGAAGTVAIVEEEAAARVVVVVVHAGV